MEQCPRSVEGDLMFLKERTDHKKALVSSKIRKWSSTETENNVEIFI